MNPGDEAALNLRCINTLRTLSIDQLQKANAGHPAIAQVKSATARRASTTDIERHHAGLGAWRRQRTPATQHPNLRASHGAASRQQRALHAAKA